MIDDFESNIVNEENSKGTSDKFYLKEFELGEDQKRETILSMATSKKYIYFLTAKHEIFRINSVTLETISESYSLPDPKESADFKEVNFNKIWCDREGNHCIIRHNNAIYYFGCSIKDPVELENFRGKEICAVALDDRNTEIKTTKNFLAVDYFNNIYECCIDIVPDEKSKNERGKESSEKVKVNDSIEKLTTLIFNDPSAEDDEESDKKRSKQINDRIYGIKFFHATNSNIDQSEDSCYIVAVSKNRFYQFYGPGLKGFKQIFSRFDRNPALFNDCCKHFPKLKKDFRVDFDILFKNESRSIGDKKSKKMDVFNMFGWRTDTGYCYGSFSHNNNDKSSGLPMELKEFTVIPFQKITDKGQKQTNVDPISVMHTINHIFILYDDCLTVVSKLTSNIVHTQYFDTKYDQMLYNEFSQDNGIILLTSKKHLYQISLKDENKDIWKDYLEIGQFDKALAFCQSDALKQKIYRINAEQEFSKNPANSANTYAFSDERFEIVCLKYLMQKDIQGLRLYLDCYKVQNIIPDENDEYTPEQNLQLNLINTWMVELLLSNKNSTENDFKNLLTKEVKKTLDKNLIYQLLLNYGKMKEYTDYASNNSDFERAVFHHINQGQINEAIKALQAYLGFGTEDKNELASLLNIFLDNSHLFFQTNPKDSINLFNNFREIEGNDQLVENAVQALMSRTDKDNLKGKNKKDLDGKAKREFDDNIKIIMDFLRELKETSGSNKSIKNQIKEQKNNINNLYIFYLSVNPANKQAVIKFLQKYLELDQSGRRKNKVDFQLDYAKRLLKDNQLAYALVLALMGKYAEGVAHALKMTPDDNNQQRHQEIAEFIANSATDKKLKKKLWIDIFRNYSESGGDGKNNKDEEKFTKAIKIMEKSKVLKIEDVLPHITDSIKIEEFKSQISECISQYEDNINKLKDNIKNYNQTAENIKMDINKIKKKSMEIKYNEFKCEICKNNIKTKNIFLFPCGHMFDMNCIRETLLNYEITGLDYLHDDNVRIDELFFNLHYIPKRLFREKEKVEQEVEEPKKGDEKEKEKEKENKLGGFLNKFKFGEKTKKEEAPVLNKEMENSYKDVLNEILSKQCVLCGDFLVDSVQCPLNQKKKIEDSNGLKLTIKGEPDFTF